MSPGDQIFVWVSSYYANGNGSDYFYIKDEMTGDSGSYRLSGNEFLSDGSSAGCVVLSPLSSSAPLADFVTVNFTGCQVSRSHPGNDNSVPAPVGIFQPFAVQMIRMNSSLATPSSLGNDSQSFSVTWQNP